MTARAHLAVDYQTNPKKSLKTKAFGFGFARNEAIRETSGAPPPSGEDALRPSLGTALSPKIQDRESRRTALSRSGRGAKEIAGEQTHSTTRITSRITKRSQIIECYQRFLLERSLANSTSGKHRHRIWTRSGPPAWNAAKRSQIIHVKWTLFILAAC
jgi:hypothetical protein